MRDLKATINKRFLETLDFLKDRGMIHSMAQLCRDAGYNDANLVRLRKEPQRELPITLLAYVADKYGVSANRILTGRGKRFVDE